MRNATNREKNDQDIFMRDTRVHQIARFQLLNLFTTRVKSRVDPDQLASEKPADLDLHCFQNRIQPGSAWRGLNIV